MSGIINGYCTLNEFLRHITPPGQTLNEDAPDDVVIENCIVQASRRVDDICGRKFYPTVETYKYDIPYDNIIWFGDDLLSIITFTNGDSSTIASTDFILKPVNADPKYCLQLRDTSTVTWQSDSNSSADQVISINAIWGYRERYAMNGWKQMGTLSAAWASTTTLTASLTANHTLEKRGGQVIRIDNELFNINSASVDTLTVQARGDNGSTAATHVILSPVYVWQQMEDIKAITLEIAKIMYRSRYGENVDVTSTYTPAGVIVTPRSLPVWAQDIIRKYQRLI